MDVLFYIVLSAAVAAGIITLLKWAAVEDSEAQALDRVAAELRELVEEQHPVVRQCAGIYPEGSGWFPATNVR
jgi:7-keto-8-aminopelargonate synthetase-like enzyme